MKRIILTLVLILAANTAHATSPCMSPSEAWFADNVAHISDTVAYGQVSDYSDAQGTGHTWTKIKIIEALTPKKLPPEITIMGWQSYFEPLYMYKKGDYIVVWLQKDDTTYHLTDPSWKLCVPSVWSAKQGGKVYDLLINKVVTLDAVRARLK